MRPPQWGHGWASFWAFASVSMATGLPSPIAAGDASAKAHQAVVADAVEALWQHVDDEATYHKADGREAAMVEFPGGYIAEIHSSTR